jgi:hypothetical protein
MTYHLDSQIFAAPIQGGGTTGPITLAVATTGNDSDPTRPRLIGSGDWSAKPFATIQAAINALPKKLDHDLLVNVGAGSFAGFSVKGFSFRAFASIIGTRELFAPATGPSSGTATYSGGGGGSGNMTMTGAGWTPGDLVGKFLTITAGSGAGYTVPIWDNTSDTIFVSYNLWFDATSEFRIEDLATKITSIPSGSYAPCYFEENELPDYLTVDSLKVTDIPTGGYPLAFYDWEAKGGVFFTRCCAQAGSGALYAGFFFAGGYSSFCEVLDADVDGYGLGFYCANAPSLYVTGLLAMRCVQGFAAYGGGSIGLEVFYGIECAKGLHVEDVHHLDSGSWGLILHDCGTGVTVYDSVFSFTHTGIFDCTVKTFELRNATLRRRTGWIYGTGNAGWGLDLHGVGNSFVDASGAPFTALTIAGTSGELTVDGTTPILWTDLDAPGDYAVDVATGARAYHA